MAVTDGDSALSVLLITYNHEQYLGQALESLFGQDYAGPIELVIADDASTDGTLELIKAYEGKDSRFIFKYLPNTTNLGITRNYQRGFAACTRRYVAVLEGDDYWVSPKKLSRQAKFLDEHWECDMCSVNYFIFHAQSVTFSERTAIGVGYSFLTARDLIADNLVGNFSTCLYRKSALERLPMELFEIQSYDWIVNICVAQSSLIGFIKEPMSVYRVHSSGAWSNYELADRLKLQLILIPMYDRITNQQFHAEFTRLERALRRATKRARFRHLTEGISWLLTHLRDVTPPIIISILRALIPPILTRRLLLICRRGRTL